MRFYVTKEDIKQALLNKEKPDFDASAECLVCVALNRRTKLTWALGFITAAYDGQEDYSKMPQHVTERIYDYMNNREVNPFSFNLNIKTLPHPNKNANKS